MRILVLTNLFPNPYQPYRATFNDQQIRALAELHELHVVAPILWVDEWKGRKRLGGSAALGRTRRVDREGMVIDHPRYFYTPKICRSLYGHFFLLSVRAAVRRAIREFSPDLLFASWAYPDGWAGVRLGRRNSLPVVVKVHGSDVHTLNEYPARYRATCDALHRADHVVAVSSDLAQEVVGLGVNPTRVSVVYNGVDDRLFHPGDRSDARKRLELAGPDFMLLFVGNLAPVKGINVLLKACRQLPSGRRFQCHIIGDGPLRRQLEVQACELGVAEVVAFHGTVPHQQLPDWYRAADAVVLPSYSEGVPNVLLESIACGTPFIASDVGGIPEIVRDGVDVLVSPGNPELLSSAILEVMSKEGVKAVPPCQRSIHQSAEELSAIFENLIATKWETAATL